MEHHAKCTFISRAGMCLENSKSAWEQYQTFNAKFLINLNTTFKHSLQLIWIPFTVL